MPRRLKLFFSLSLSLLPWSIRGTGRAWGTVRGTWALLLLLLGQRQGCLCGEPTPRLPDSGRCCKSLLCPPLRLLLLRIHTAPMRGVARVLGTCVVCLLLLLLLLLVVLLCLLLLNGCSEILFRRGEKRMRLRSK